MKNSSANTESSADADFCNGPGDFRKRVEDIVRHIPPGRVMTYGQLAALCGSAGAARVVGGIAHFGDLDLAWQRVVNKQGGLASGYPGGRVEHAAALRAEGLAVSDEHKVDVAELLWWPPGYEPDNSSFQEDHPNDQR